MPHSQGRPSVNLWPLLPVVSRLGLRKGTLMMRMFCTTCPRGCRSLQGPPRSIHALYGDEIQDFTQAELALLMKCINDPNAMFLTGTRPRASQKGGVFRQRPALPIPTTPAERCGQECAVRKPKKIHQLYQNPGPNSCTPRPWACLMGEVLGTDLGAGLKNDLVLLGSVAEPTSVFWRLLVNTLMNKRS